MTAPGRYASSVSKELHIKHSLAEKGQHQIVRMASFVAGKI